MNLLSNYAELFFSKPYIIMRLNHSGNRIDIQFAFQL